MSWWRATARPDHSAGAEALLRYLCQAAADTDLRIADGETARYGFSTVEFSDDDDDMLAVHDPGSSVADEAVEVFDCSG